MYENASYLVIEKRSLFRFEPGFLMSTRTNDCCSTREQSSRLKTLGSSKKFVELRFETNQNDKIIQWSQTKKTIDQCIKQFRLEGSNPTIASRSDQI